MKGLNWPNRFMVKALDRFDELTGPYATVIDVQIEGLPTAEEVNAWSGR